MKTPTKPAKTVRLAGVAANHKSAAGEHTKTDLNLQTALKAAEFKIEMQTWQIEELVAANTKLRSARKSTDDFLQREILKLRLEIANLTEKLDAANKQLVWFRNNKYNKTSEKAGAKPAAAA